MRIQILSDLHIEFKSYRIEVARDTEVLVIAGDFAVANSLDRLETFAESIKKPIVFVAGNHDYYGGVLDAVNKKLERIDNILDNFDFLNNRCVRIGDVKFIGSTLWSNFDLAPNPIEFACLVGPRVIDFQIIGRSLTSKFSPHDCMKLNEESRLFLRGEINAPYDGKKVVVTHFLPSPKSIHPKYEHDVLNPYFACNCENLMGPNVPLWIHGHTHESIDYVCKGTHVITNPRGYFGENRRFDGKLMVDA